MVSVLDLEQYHLRGRILERICPGCPHTRGHQTILMFLSLRCQFRVAIILADDPAVRLKDQTTKPSATGRLDDLILIGLVGRGGLEPPTSRLSGVRSNQLSYRPGLACRAVRTGIGMVEPIGIEPMTS